MYDQTPYARIGERHDLPPRNEVDLVLCQILPLKKRRGEEDCEKCHTRLAVKDYWTLCIELVNDGLHHKDETAPSRVG